MGTPKKTKNRRRNTPARPRKMWALKRPTTINAADQKKRPTLDKQERPYGGPNPAQKFKSTQEPEKYPFDPEIDAVNRLAQLFNIQSKDLHNANIMKRADGHLVFVDVGLFDTTAMVSEVKKRKIYVKFT